VPCICRRFPNGHKEEIQGFCRGDTQGPRGFAKEIQGGLAGEVQVARQIQGLREDLQKRSRDLGRICGRDAGDPATQGGLTGGMHGPQEIKKFRQDLQKKSKDLGGICTWGSGGCTGKV
jgi:hypothetical protein